MAGRGKVPTLVLSFFLSCMISVFGKVAWQPRGLAGSWVGLDVDGSFLNVFLGMSDPLRGWITAC